MRSSTYIPDAGDLIALMFDGTRGREQSGRRPGLVLSPAIYNEATSRAVVCPLTTKARGYPFEVPLPAANRFAVGVILADQLRSLDWRARQASRIGRVDGRVLAKVRDHIMRLIMEE